MILIVSRMYMRPPSGSNGASEANTVLSTPKNARPHFVASSAEQRGVGVEVAEVVDRPFAF